jgi:predicted NBD/HSP70 family sugar kinase/biotin operon repressor
MRKNVSVTGTSNTDIKLHNLSAILLTLLHNENISRVHLAQQLGISAATITNLVSEMRDKGHIVETGSLPNNGQVGRRQRALQLVPDSGFAIGLHIDVGRVYIGLTNLLGIIIDRSSFEHNLDEPAEAVLDKAVNHIQQMIDRHTERRQQIVGMGVAASGLVDIQRGVNVMAPNLNWFDVPIQEYIAQKMDYPIIVDNNVRAMAFGEALFGTARKYNVMAFIYGRIGVGSGLVINRQLYRGAWSGAGEIGHTRFVCSDSTPQSVIPLEKLVSEPAILSLAKRRTGQPYTFPALLEAARMGDKQLLELLDESACYLGIAIANLVNIFNPELIVLGGIFREAQDLILTKVREIVNQYTFAHIGERVEIRVTPFGNEAGIIGAAALALDAFFYRPQAFQREVQT